MTVQGGQVAALATALATALAVLVAPERTQALHASWVWLLCALGVACSRALNIGWPAPAGALAALALSGLTLLWPRWLPERTGTIPDRVEYAFGAEARFTEPGQALERTVPLPDEWDTLPVFLRLDLARHYDGPARLHAAVNGVDIGELGPESGVPMFEPPAGAPAWGLRVPSVVLGAGEPARVVLRPTLVDRALAIAIHPDARITPARVSPSRFFDGLVWRDDRLAGPDGPDVRGAYRVWFQVR